MPADYTSLPTLVVDDPIRASYLALLDATLDLFDARSLERAIPLQAAVAGVESASFVDVPYPIEWVPVVSGDVAVTYYSKATDAATSVQLRLYDVTASAAVSGSTSTANSTTSGWTKETKSPVSVIAGHTYRLQISGSDAANPVIGYATLL